MPSDATVFIQRYEVPLHPNKRRICLIDCWASKKVTEKRIDQLQPGGYTLVKPEIRKTETYARRLDTGNGLRRSGSLVRRITRFLPRPKAERSPYPKNFTDTTSPLPAPLSMLPRPSGQGLPGRPAWLRGHPPNGAAAHRH